MTSPWKWQTLKTNARWKAGQTLMSRPGEALEGDGLGALRRLEADGGARLQARFVPGEVALWEERARKVSVLGHPNIVPVVGVGSSEGHAFLVEERPEGESLRRWIARSPAQHPDLKDVERVLGAVVAGMRHAHDVSIFHGGLSAACVSVARDGVGDFDVRIGGFGLLHALRDRRAALSPELWDTLAPELTDDAKAPDAAADAYAFGVLLVECVSGSMYPRGSRHAWRELAATPDALRRRLGESREGIPKTLCDLAAGLLTGDPAARSPKTARDLARSLQRQVWELEEVVAPPPPPRRSVPADDGPAAPMGPAVAKVVSVTTRRVSDVPTPTPAAPPETPRRATASPAPPEPLPTLESPAAAPPTEEMPAARAGDATLVDAEERRPSVPRPFGPRGDAPKATPAPPPRGGRLAARPPMPPTPPKTPSRFDAGTATLLDEDVPQHEPPSEASDDDGSGTLPLGGRAGGETLAYEEEGAPWPGGAEVDGAARTSPMAPTREVKAIPRVLQPAEAATTLPIGEFAGDAPTTPRIRPSQPSSAPGSIAPSPSKPSPPTPRIERTMPDAGPTPPPAPKPPPPLGDTNAREEATGFLGDPRLTPPVLAGLAVGVMVLMGLLGWLAAWALRP